MRQPSGGSLQKQKEMFHELGLPIEHLGTGAGVSGIACSGTPGFRNSRANSVITAITHCVWGCIYAPLIVSAMAQTCQESGSLRASTCTASF